MPTDVSYDPLDDQDDFDAASLNSRFRGIADSLDDIPTYALRDGALMHKHVNATVTLATAAGQDTINLTGARQFTAAAYPGFETAGWTVLNDGASDLEYDFGSDLTLQAQGGSAGLTGVLVFLNVHLYRMVELVGGSINTGLYLAFAIEWKDDGATWNQIGRTERFVSMGSRTDQINVDIPIRTLITRNDTGGNDIRAIRGVVSRVNTVSANGMDAYIVKANIIGLPLYADYPS